jgi:anti-sigma factor RsiW
MDCKTVRERLGDYMDGTAGTTERQMIEEHLTVCTECASALEDLRKTVGRLGTLEDVEPPAWLSQKVMMKIRDERRKMPLLRRLFYPLGVKVPIRAAATVLIAVTTIYIFRTMQHEVLPPRTMPAPQEKGKDAGAMTGRRGTPSAIPEAAKGVPHPQEITAKESAGEKRQPGLRYAPAPPSATGKAVPLKEEKAVGSFNEPENMGQEKAMHDTAGPEKSPRAGTVRTEAAGAVLPDERMRAENVPGTVHTPLQKSEKVLWTDETITKDDVAKVVKVALVRETAAELVFEVEYYLSDAFAGTATVGIYPDIPDRSGGEAPALRGKHTVSISVSRAPSAMPGASRILSIEIVRQEDAVPRRPLYRRTVPFVKRWGSN